MKTVRQAFAEVSDPKGQNMQLLAEVPMGRLLAEDLQEVHENSAWPVRVAAVKFGKGQAAVSATAGHAVITSPVTAPVHGGEQAGRYTGKWAGR